jgi:thioredoxin-like negative regulator of GroEL
MGPVLKLFILPTCPYCKQVLKWMEELKNENEAYVAVKVNIIDEKQQPDVAAQHDYYYVPTFFLDGEKVHEGAATKDKVQKVFDQFLAK